MESWQSVVVTSALARVTVNLTESAGRALTVLAPGVGKTAAICRALRLAAAVRDLADESGVVTVLGPGRSRTKIVVL
ncbi:hypothetical protein O7627_23795 [Solwaraspora sp. WMMD1047]|uniref:hypothetical protein n=1 Tax=Solwaraspora sp. WMMD1047 TaxID=3016102 RepID=UPI002417465B|nr:hypothetical protein [Solwaraspora sp. WMMD1047]MDG4832309.1 hypothetical protein [Solwaraspora sp. WMMD1047]